LRAYLAVRDKKPKQWWTLLYEASVASAASVSAHKHADGQEADVFWAWIAVYCAALLGAKSWTTVED
jgi:hypothetical protein